MNKNRIYISIILLFVLVTNSINYTYCADQSLQSPLDGAKAKDSLEVQQQKELNKKNEEKKKKEDEYYSFLLTAPEESHTVTEEEEDKVKEYGRKYQDQYLKLKEKDSKSLSNEEKDIIKKFNNALEYHNKYEKQKKAKKQTQIETLIVAKDLMDTGVETITNEKEDTSKYSITSQSFMNNWNPVNSNQGAFVEEGTKPITNLIVFIVNKVLGLIQIFSGILMVLCITYTGFNMILSIKSDVASDIGLNFVSMGGEKSPTLKKRVLDNIRRLLIGSILTFSSTTLVKIAFSLFTSF